MDIDSRYVRVVAKFQAFKKCGSAFANMPLAMEANIGIMVVHTWPLWPHILSKCIPNERCGSFLCNN